MKRINDEWEEITPEELNAIFESYDEIELDIDEFISEHEQSVCEQRDEEESYREELKSYSDRIRYFLEVKDYRQAFKAAMILREKSYSPYKKEIDNCIKVCAEHDVRGTIVVEAGNHDDYRLKRYGKTHFDEILETSEIAQ